MGFVSTLRLIFPELGIKDTTYTSSHVGLSLSLPAGYCGRRFLTLINIALLTALSAWKFFYVRQVPRSSPLSLFYL